MKKIQQDVRCGTFLLGLCAFAFITSKDIAAIDTRSVVMPYIAMSIIAILGIAIIIQGIKKSIAAAKAGELPKQYFSVKEMKVPLITFAFIAGYIIAFKYIGYMVATPIFLIALMRYLKMKDWKTIIIITVIFMLVVYFGFTKRYM